MDDNRFDHLTRSIARTSNRRGFIKGILALVGITGAGAALRASEVDGARRGFSGPTWPESPTTAPTAIPTQTFTQVATSTSTATTFVPTPVSQGGFCVAQPDDNWGKCREGLECCDGLCGHPRDVAGSCTSHLHCCTRFCASDGTCAEFVLSPTPTTIPEGEPCTVPGPLCATGLMCCLGICSFVLPRGSPCDDSSQCCSGVCNDDGLCR
jgi:hypothetical protein